MGTGKPWAGHRIFIFCPIFLTYQENLLSVENVGDFVPMGSKILNDKIFTLLCIPVRWNGVSLGPTKQG